MNFLIDKYNKIADKVVGAEVEFVLRPVGEAITDSIVFIAHALTESMPEIGAGIVVVCAVGMMLTGNIPKWLGRIAVGVGGAILWLLNA